MNNMYINDQRSSQIKATFSCEQGHELVVESMPRKRGGNWALRSCTMPTQKVQELNVGTVTCTHQLDSSGNSCKVQYCCDQLLTIKVL